MYKLINVLWSLSSLHQCITASTSLGHCDDTTIDVVQSEYSADMSVEQAVALSNKAIERALGEQPIVEIGVVSAKDGRRFQKLS